VRRTAFHTQVLGTGRRHGPTMETEATAQDVAASRAQLGATVVLSRARQRLATESVSSVAKWGA
jgi:hypothetical protein